MNQPQTLYVISDLHLGGRAGFQMCPPAARRHLAQFIRWVSAQHRPEHAAHLILNGDIVDFLAEAPYASFTASGVEAAAKLGRILDSATDVVEALAGHTERGAPLTLLLGNHDVELSFPQSRRLLHERIGRACFLYDGEALRVGPVLIEHGNRYDPWNAVPLPQLTEVRAALSRGEEAPEQLPHCAGSVLVTQVMNHIKEEDHLRFVDLLKPEDDAAVAVLAALKPTLALEVSTCIGMAKVARAGINQLVRRLLGKVQLPTGPWQRTGGGDEDQTPEDQLSAEILGLLPESLQREYVRRERQMGYLDSLAEGRHAGMAGTREDMLRRLLAVLRRRRAAFKAAFEPSQEVARYREPAEAAELHGCQVVLFGHSHLAKQVSLPRGGVYLNTGTWAELMQITDEDLKDEGSLDALLRDLQTSARRFLRPTYARVQLTAEARVVGDPRVFQYGGVDEPERSFG